MMILRTTRYNTISEASLLSSSKNVRMSKCETSKRFLVTYVDRHIDGHTTGIDYPS